MHCPFCNFSDTKVIDSRLTVDNSQVKRRRECVSCENRWSTLESSDLNLPRVIKKDNSREDFSEKKIERGIIRALNKRSIDKGAIDIAIQNIKNKTFFESKILNKEDQKYLFENIKDINVYKGKMLDKGKNVSDIVFFKK